MKCIDCLNPDLKGILKNNFMLIQAGDHYAIRTAIDQTREQIMIKDTNTTGGV